MSLPRLVVIDGPDKGQEFAVGPAGGGIGRGEGNAVQLSDLAVSRNHCLLRVEGGGLVLVDSGSRNRTLVNGDPVSEHRLARGDVIAIGKTRLEYVPPEGGVVVSRVTIEVSSDELLRARMARDPTRAIAVADPAAERARRHLAALARVGDGVRRRSTDRAALTRLICEAARDALDADRAELMLPEGGRLVSSGSSAVEGAPPVALPAEVHERCLRKGAAIVVESQATTGIAAPLALTDGATEVRGLLWAEHSAPAGWGEPDVQLLACLAHLASAALDSLAARDALAVENRALEERLGGGREFIGSSPVSRELLGFVSKVASSDATVLLLGESGSGKEMVAAAIHHASRRARGPFVCLSCATLTDTLLESELFGHEKGSFTGATERKVGRFELAHGGTLFFDEVAELTPRCQTKLLRVLEERTFERVGGTKSISVDVRVIAATNRSLADMVPRGEFREDLFYRLSVIQHVVPPLRARRDDIPALADHFLARVRFQTGRRVTGFSAEALRALLAHPWPGNCRELKNAVERAVVLGEGDLVRLADLPPQVIASAPAALAPPTMPAGVAPSPGPPSPRPLSPTQPPLAATVAAASLRQLERQGILAALSATGGNKAQAAQILEIDRSTLYKKLKEYGIES